MGESENRSTIPPGTVLVGKYRVDRVIGSGGMGVVVAATHLELREQVAVKFLQPEALENEEAAQRFVREARAAVKIKSLHVAKVTDVGRLESGAPYMVMEYLQGHDLSDFKHGERPAIEDVVDYVIQTCDAMAEAHSLGIIHRDLKPANLFLTTAADGTPVVKVLDFGISKVSLPDMSGFSLTRTSTAMGSPLYMSPEQMRSAKNVDHRTDIWSLGVILFELLTGQTPFTGGSLPELCASILSDAPPSVRSLRPDVPEALDAVVMRCLEKDVTRRYSNVGELSAGLAPFAPPRSLVVVERVSRLMTLAGHSSPPPEPRRELVTVPDGAKRSATGALTNPETIRTDAGWAETAASAPKKSAALPLVIGVVAVGAIAATAWAFAGRKSSMAAEPSASAIVAAAPSASPTRSAVASAVPEVEPTLPSASAPTPSASATPTKPEPATTQSKPRAKSEPPKPEPKAEPKPEPKPEPPPVKPKNPLDIGLK